MASVEAGLVSPASVCRPAELPGAVFPPDAVEAPGAGVGQGKGHDGVCAPGSASGDDSAARAGPTTGLDARAGLTGS